MVNIVSKAHDRNKTSEASSRKHVVQSLALQLPNVKEAWDFEIGAYYGSICWQLKECKRTKEAGWGEPGVRERIALENEWSPSDSLVGWFKVLGMVQS